MVSPMRQGQPFEAKAKARMRAPGRSPRTGPTQYYVLGHGSLRSVEAGTSTLPVAAPFRAQLSGIQAGCPVLSQPEDQFSLLTGTRVMQ